MTNDKDKCFNCNKWFYHKDLFNFDKSGYPFCKDCIKDMKEKGVKIK